MAAVTGGTGPTGITALGHEVFQIDTRMAGYDGITAGYLIRGDRPCLVETGTAPSAPVVRDALAWLGIGADDLATVVVTHIHLDHAGGAGDIAAMFPAAQIVVHQRGARHLADPSRLMAGARLVYGNALERLFGVLAPVPAERIVALDDAGTVDLGGGRRLDSHYSPGHAKHHVGLVDSDSGDLYVGDAAGVYLPETGDVRPATPPPDFDLDTALASVRRFAALRPARLLFSHFGPVTQVSETLDRSAEEITVWVEETRQARAAGLDLDHAVAMVLDRTKHRYLAASPDADPAIAEKFERVSGALGNVEGIMHWLGKTGRLVRPRSAAARCRRGWVNPQSDLRTRSRRDALAWRRSMRARGRCRLARRCVVVQVVVFQVVELDAVELIEAVGRVGLAVGVGLGGPGERIPGLVRAPGRQQRIRVGVEEPRGPGPHPTAGQLGDLQGQDGGLGQALVPADAGLDDPQLDLRGPVEVGGIGLPHQRQRPVQPAEGPLAIGHDRQVVVPPGHAPRGP